MLAHPYLLLLKTKRNQTYTNNPTFAINTLTLLLRLELPAPPQCSPDVTKGPGQLDILHLMVIMDTVW